MSVLINQFGMTTLAGVLDQRVNANVFQCRASSTLVAGQAVKLASTVGSDVPVVTAVTADTDEVFGYVVYSIKKSTIASGDAVEIASVNSIMYMTAGAAVSAGAEIMFVTASSKVITATGVTKVISGWAFDAAAADGDLMRVYITAPSYKHPAA